MNNSQDLKLPLLLIEEKGCHFTRYWDTTLDIAGKELVPAMPPPEWLPDGWDIEFRKRKQSDRIDKYYVCPLSGKKLRSRLEVLRFLTDETLDHPAMHRPATPSLAVVGERPEWLPDGWSVDFRKREGSNTIDKYYICPLSGKKLRSRLEVMRFLNGETLDYHAVHRPATTSLAVVGERPKWLPDGWSVDFRKREGSNTIDKYYICPISGKRLRSRPEVMRFLNNEMPRRARHHPGRSLAVAGNLQKCLPNGWSGGSRKREAYDTTNKYYIDHDDGCRYDSKSSCYTQNEEACQFANMQKRTNTTTSINSEEDYLPIFTHKRAKVIRPAVRKSLFAEEGPMSKVSTDATCGNDPKKQALSHLFQSSAQLHEGASDMSCSSANEHVEQRIIRYKIEGQPNFTFHGELHGRTAAKISTDTGSKKLSLIHLEGEKLPIPDANLSEGEPRVLSKKQNQPKRHISGELQEKSAIEVLREPKNEELSDATLSEEKRHGSTEKLIQLKSQGINEELPVQLDIKTLQEPRNEKPSESLMHPDGDTQLVPDVNIVEEKQCEVFEKLSQHIRPSRGYQCVLEDTETVRSVISQPGLQKGKAVKTEITPLQISEYHAGIITPISNSGTESQFRRDNIRKTQQCQNEVCVTIDLQEKLKNLNPFGEHVCQEQQADQIHSSLTKKDSDGSCYSGQENMIASKEKIEWLKPFVKQSSQKQEAACIQSVSCPSLETDEHQERIEPNKELASHSLEAMLFGDSWLEPCLDFALTLNTDFPALEDAAAIEDYFQ